LRQGLFIAKPTPFYGDFGIFEDSREVEEMFHRMVFNYLTDNKDEGGEGGEVE